MILVIGLVTYFIIKLIKILTTIIIPYGVSNLGITAWHLYLTIFIFSLTMTFFIILKNRKFAGVVDSFVSSDRTRENNSNYKYKSYNKRFTNYNRKNLNTKNLRDHY